MKTILIDKEALLSLYGDCQDSLNEVLSEFIRSYQETKQNLSTAFSSGNLQSLKRLLHFHGPSFMYLGLPQVAEMFKTLENKCIQAGNHFMVSEDFSALMKAIEISYQEVLKQADCFKKAV